MRRFHTLLTGVIAVTTATVFVSQSAISQVTTTSSSGGAATTTTNVATTTGVVGTTTGVKPSVTVSVLPSSLGTSTSSSVVPSTTTTVVSTVGPKSILAAALPAFCEAQPGTQLYGSGGAVTAQVVTSPAGASSDVASLSSPSVVPIGGNATSGAVVPSAVAALGTFGLGQELIFQITASYPPLNWFGTLFTGPGSRNVDGCVKAVVTPITGGYSVAFEDRNYNITAGGDYNDLILEVKGAVSNTAPVTTLLPSVVGGSLAKSGVVVENTRTRSDPVNTATGSFTHEVSDVAVPGVGVPFIFGRAYDSRSTVSGPLGAVWGSTLFESMSLNATTGAVTWKSGTGTEVVFPSNGAGGFTAGPGVIAKVFARTGGGWDMVRQGQEKSVFDAAGKVINRVDRVGKGLTYTYNASNQLASISDAGGRIHTFTYVTVAPAVESATGQRVRSARGDKSA
jgi:YD repeat-containing protein